jgi:predicted aspartyl protease
VLFGDIHANACIDTGSQDDIITEGLAARLGLVPKVYLTPDGKTIPFEGASLKTVTVPGVKMGAFLIKDSEFVVLPDQRMAQLAGSVDGDAIDGVLGLSFLQRSALLFDYKNRTISITIPGYPTDNLMAMGFTNASPIPLKKSPDDLMYYVKATLSTGEKSADVDLIIDSGAEFISVPFSIAQKLSLDANGNQTNLHPAGGDVTLRSVILPSISIGKFYLIQHQVSYVSESTSNPFYVFGLSEANFGGYRVLIDFPKSAMYVVSNHS